MRRNSPLLVTAAVAALTVTTVVAGTSSAAPGTPSLTWQPCPARGVPVECTSLTVPIDWSRRGGPTVDLKVGRLRATGERLGSVMFNPGGPGGSGVDFLSGFASRFGSPLREHYDLVSWDPRGIAGSAPLTCPKEIDERFSKAPAPTTVSERLQFEKLTRQWVQACRKASGPLFDHVDTLSNVRDLDRLREVLGERKLNFAGFSYGSRIGLFYADVFPQRVGHLVVDAVVDPTSDNADFYDGASRAVEQAFTDYLAQCAERKACPLTDLTAAQARAWLARKLLEIPDLGSVPNLLRDPRNWPALDQVLGQVRDGTFTPSSDPGESQITYHAVQCLDLPDRRDARRVMADAERAATRNPLLGWLSTTTVVCPQWPVPPTYHPHPIVAPGSAPILVVGTTHDTATPYDWAVHAARDLQNARLLTNQATHHGGYGSSACVTEAVDQYFVTGTLPGVGKVCTG